MKIILAPDKFKNSLTGLAFCNAVEQGIKTILPTTEIIKLPLADGGDGTIDVVNYYLNGNLIKVSVNNPFFKQVKAAYLYSKTSKTAFIEMAEASGVKLLNQKELDCKNTTSFGTGELILDAIEKGASKIILGIGGSATNDCGIGMATALGFKFLDAHDKEVTPIGANLSNIKTIDVSRAHPKLKDINIQIACDVSNPLHGKHGAAYVYAAQKGASANDIKMLDKGLYDFSKILEATFGVDVQFIKGAGAAGGMGIASKIFLGAQLKSGVELIKTLANFDKKIINADWIITGEGKLDSQTLSGKTIKGIIASAKAKKINVAAFCGTIDLEREQTNEFGINYTDAVMNYAKDFNDAISNTYNYVTKIAKVFASTLKETTTPYQDLIK